MFNVSTLLLDDAFKPATPLTNCVISEMGRQFVPLSDISQGSVATQMKCGGIFSDGIIANFLLILIVKQFRKSVNIWKTYTAYKNCANFLRHPKHASFHSDILCNFVNCNYVLLVHCCNTSENDQPHAYLGKQFSVAIQSTPVKFSADIAR